MSCFWELCREYYNKIMGKNWITDLKRKDAFVSVKVICNCDNIDPYKECKVLNKLYENYNIVDQGFDLFFVNQIKAIKYSYDSTVIFTSNNL